MNLMPQVSEYSNNEKVLNLILNVQNHLNFKFLQFERQKSHKSQIQSGNIVKFLENHVQNLSKSHFFRKNVQL